MASIWSQIPVRSSMPGGTGMPGLTSEANSPIRRPPRTLTAAISVIPAAAGDQPVVSRSITANSSSASATSANGASSPNDASAAVSSTGFGGASSSSARSSSRAITVGLVTHITVDLPTDIPAPGTPRPALSACPGPGVPGNVSGRR